ncbi:MAG: CPBP family intramembrane metalloprotease [Bacilli bacterium]|nr:CPBP family intramembrane metalloprotease [Bacilli bacterium]
MLYKKTTCTSCNKDFDEAYEKCPFCLADRQGNNGLKYQNRLAWFPILHQLLFFLIGLFGLMVFNVLFEVIFLPLYETNISRFTILVNFLSYILLFIALLLIFCLNRKFRYFFSHFLDWRSYVAGIAVCGLIYGLTVLYNILLSLGYNVTDGLNQQTSVNMIQNYPTMSFFMIVLLGPICEEITYRLGLFTLLSRVNRYLAYTVTILVFSLIHFKFNASNLLNELANLPNYLIAGFFLTLVYEKFGISASFIAHIANNLLSFILILC